MKLRQKLFISSLVSGIVFVLLVIILAFSDLSGWSFALLIISLALSLILAFSLFTDALKYKPQKDSPVGKLVDSLVRSIFH